MPEMRAKFRVVDVVTSKEHDDIVMCAVTEDGGEDQTFAKYTPGGDLTIMVSNPALRGQFKVGDKYYLDFTKAE
tara:strand:+ start:362 stop:583 length:222 start_codon:yes stop_codon:yes gene_type:complete